MTTIEQRAAEEAEVARWARRRRIRLELAGLGWALLYAAYLFAHAPELRGLAVAFPFLAVLIRLAAWRWEDRAARTTRDRNAYALAHHRLPGWAREYEVGAVARQRVRRGWWGRLGVAVAFGALVLLAVLVVDASERVAVPVALTQLAVAGAVLAVGAVTQERELREARRWLADPPGRDLSGGGAAP